MRTIPAVIRCKIFLSILTAALLLPAAAGQAQEANPESRFVKLEIPKGDAMRVHYEDFGKGNEALIFIHGWSCNLKFWKANIPAFTKQSRVIAIDLPGHGESDKPQIPYSMDLFASAINAVMADGKVERAVLIGHSMGAPVIRQFYRKYPNKTLALVIVDGSLKPIVTPEQMESFLAGFRSPDYKKVIEGAVDGMTKPMKDRKAVEEIKASMTSTPQHVVVGAAEGMLDPAIWTPDKIQVPTLIVMAKNARSQNPEYVKFVHELAPAIDYQTWEGVSHFLMMDEPQKFDETVTVFLKKNRLVK